mgnify:CR=1 FL=1
MSAIDEGIVREYFEQNGFLVRQARKYQVAARRKLAALVPDLIQQGITTLNVEEIFFTPMVMLTAAYLYMTNNEAIAAIGKEGALDFVNNNEPPIEG